MNIEIFRANKTLRRRDNQIDNLLQYGSLLYISHYINLKCQDFKEMSYKSSSYKYGWCSFSIFLNDKEYNGSTALKNLQAISDFAGKKLLSYPKIYLKQEITLKYLCPILNISTKAFQKMINFLFNIDIFLLLARNLQPELCEFKTTEAKLFFIIKLYKLA